MKPVLGPPRTARASLNARNPDGGIPNREFCTQVHPSDGAGNVLLESVLLNVGGPPSYPGLYAFDPSGAPLAQAVVQELTGPSIGYSLRSGWFLGAIAQFPSFNTFLLSRFPPSLQAPSIDFSGDFPFAFATLPPGGGTAVVAVTSPPTFDASCPDPPGRLLATSFDAAGAAVFRAAPLGCGSGNPLVSVGKNAAGDVLVLVDSVAWHVTPDGTVTQRASQLPESPLALLQPLVDGRFALYDGRAWTATVDLDGNASPPPCWLQQRSDVFPFQIVLAGQAYLAYHTAPLRDPINPHPQACDRYAELILADGTSCGLIPLTGTEECSDATVSVGLDGTLTTLDLGTCTASFWPAAFR